MSRTQQLSSILALALALWPTLAGTKRLQQKLFPQMGV